MVDLLVNPFLCLNDEDFVLPEQSPLGRRLLTKFTSIRKGVHNKQKKVDKS